MLIVPFCVTSGLNCTFSFFLEQTTMKQLPDNIFHLKCNTHGLMQGEKMWRGAGEGGLPCSLLKSEIIELHAEVCRFSSYMCCITLAFQMAKFGPQASLLSLAGQFKIVTWPCRAFGTTFAVPAPPPYNHPHTNTLLKGPPRFSGCCIKTRKGRK